MADDKAKAFFILNEDDVIDRAVADAIERSFTGWKAHALRNQETLGNHLINNMAVQGSLRNLITPLVNDAIREALKQNLRVDHYYEQYNRTAGYRIRYGSDIIQQEQIKIGF